MSATNFPGVDARVATAITRPRRAAFLSLLVGAVMIAAVSPSEGAHRLVHGFNVDQHTSAPLKQFRQVKLLAPPGEVFAFVADHEGMSEWIPMMHRVSVDHSESANGPGQCGVGSMRYCTIKPDTIAEKIVAWEPGVMYAYRVIDGQKGVPINGGLGVVTFEPADDGDATLLTWRIFYTPKKWSLKAKVMPAMVGFQLGGGLKNLTKHFGGSVIKND